jgi:hypothetical protein
MNRDRLILSVKTDDIVRKNWLFCQFLQTISNDPDLGRVAYNHEYTLRFIANTNIFM